MSIWWLLKRSGKELAIVAGILTVLFALPIISVVVLAASPSSVVSAAFANVNPVTHMVDIFDPDGNKIREMEVSTVWPGQGYISSVFGEDRGPKYGVHSGIDIADNFGRVGQPVTPFAEGKVTLTDNEDNSGCGKNISVDHGSGVVSRYCHLSVILTTENNTVRPGDIIGLTGMTGLTTGPHLHFQINIYDIPVNPRIFMIGEPIRAVR